MLLTKTIKIIINSSNFKHFSVILNKVIKVKEVYDIDIEHISKTSNVIIEAKCDICGKIINTKYYNYYRNISKHNLYTCKNCSNIKTEKTCLDKYGVINYANTNESKDKQKQTCLDKYGFYNPMKLDYNIIKIKDKLSSTKEDFIKKSNMIHNNKYDYSKVIYINNKTKVKIYCPIHGEFEQRPDSHLNNKGCAKCSNKKNIFFKDKSVYIIKDIDNNLYKIGVSYNVKNRLRCIINETRCNIILVNEFKNKGLEELKIHKYYKNNRIVHPIKHGGFTEWFSFDDDTILTLENDIENILENKLK